MNIIAYFLILAAIGLRVLRHFGYIDLPPNFAPIAAMALFAGTYLDKKQAFIIPLLAMLISDIFIGFYNPAIMISVYLCFILSVVIGIYIKKNKNIYNIIGGSLLSSVIFYLLTNYAVWVFGGMYAHNFAGLAQCYALAIPFFKYTLLGDLFYVSVLFGGYELVKYLISKRTKSHYVGSSVSLPRE